MTFLLFERIFIEKDIFNN